MTFRRQLLKVYWRCERLLTPGLRYAQLEYEEQLRKRVDANSRWLDLGCGHHVLPEWRKNAEIELISQADLVIGVDLDEVSIVKHRSIRRLALSPIDRLPFAGGAFSLVTANMVAEHLEFPKRCFQEIARVLALGGLFILHTPNAGGYVASMAKYLPNRLKTTLVGILAGRAEEDHFPTFYRANSPAQLHRLAQESGLDVEEIQLLASSAETSSIPPLAFLELLWIRQLMKDRNAHLRTNIIAIFRKQSSALAGAKGAE